MKFALAVMLLMCGCAPAVQPIDTAPTPTPEPPVATTTPITLTPTPTPISPAVIVTFSTPEPEPTATPEPPLPTSMPAPSLPEGWKSHVYPPPEWLLPLIDAAMRPGWNNEDRLAWVELVALESTYDPSTQNPTSTAYGLGQFLNPTSACTPALKNEPACYDTWALVGCQKTSDPAEQIRCMGLYIEQRHGTPGLALEYHRRNNSY